MAKMFYSLEEAAAKLGMSTDEVQGMASSGQLQEFRDSSNALVFKTDQIDLIAGDDDTSNGLGDSAGASGSMIPLNLDDSAVDLGGSGLGGSDAGGDSGLDPLTAGGSGSAIDLEGSDFDVGLEASGSVPGLAGDLSGLDLGGGNVGSDAPTNEGTGISIFDVDEDDADPSAQTQTAEGLDFTPEFAADAGASGSGLLDLTRESDDTSLGADLLDDLYGGGDTQNDSGEEGEIGEASALFESTGAESDVSGVASAGGVAMVPAAFEVYDGTWSGIAGGVSLGAAVTLATAISVMVLAMTGGGGPLLDFVGGNLMAVIGGLVGVVVIAAVVGLLLGKKSG
ncbi:MAG: hypothetical protein AAFY58_03270 [Planctomycetota bacterium]